MSLRYLFCTIVLVLILISCVDNSEKISTPSVDLLTAIDKENVAIVKQHIDAGTNINNYPIPKGIPLEGAQPLHLAVVKGYAEIVQLLLENGAKIDIKAKNKDQATPLSWAVFFQQKEMVSLLIKSGANINALDVNGLTSIDGANYVKITVLKDLNKLKVIQDILAILYENGGLSASDI
mgnify:CR=1 FL=1